MSTVISTNPESEVTHLRPAPLRQRPAMLLGLGLLIAIGILRIVSTYHVFNHTIDEGAHLACGIQWFSGSYTYDQKHTPVARIAEALLPYLDGVRSFGNESFWREGVLLLSTRGRYWHNLTLARIGALPFFVLATVVVFLWSRRIYGYGTALIAAGIFSMLPVVLGHAGLAATDIPLAACYITAVYAFTLWLEAPTWGTTARFGLATGLAVATKLSTVAFLPATVIGILPLYFLSRGRASAGGNEKRWGLGSVRGVLRAAVVMAICGFFVIWTTYKFSHAPIQEISPAAGKMAVRIFGGSSSAGRGVHFLTAKVPIPAPELWEGLRALRDINAVHPPSYMFGQVKHGGWWYFYPVAIAVKTPLAALVLALIGGVSLAVTWLRTRADWQRVVPIVGFFAPIVIAMPTSLDIGVRHVMPVFAFLSMLAAAGVVRLWSGARRDHLLNGPQVSWAGRVATVVLLAWFAVSSVRAHPDYLSYFNELGGKHPENILLISDLDWGQDMARLSTYLREHDVKHVSIAYDGFYDPDALGFPESEHVECGVTPSGWVAIELRRSRLYRDCYPWMEGHQPVAQVGPTTLIYKLEDRSGAMAPENSPAKPGAAAQGAKPPEPNYRSKSAFSRPVTGG